MLLSIICLSLSDAHLTSPKCGTRLFDVISQLKNSFRRSKKLSIFRVVSVHNARDLTVRSQFLLFKP